MARSRAIWVVRCENPANPELHFIEACFTVKHEMETWCASNPKLKGATRFIERHSDGWYRRKIHPLSTLISKE